MSFDFVFNNDMIVQGSDDSETSRADDFIEYEKDEKRQKHRTKRQKELNIPEGYCSFSMLA